MAFADDLNRYGPEASYRLSREEAIAYCARLTASHYENFSVVTWLTPRDLRPAFAAVYAFCRWSDDLGDEVGDRQKARALLAWWRGELQALYNGEARHPVMIALADVVRAFAIPIGPFEALISAFEQDQEVLDYETYPQLLDYCTRSANPVGHLVLYLGRVFNAENAALADCTCTGLQLANFWQDVARDLAIGRLYLPREDREIFGVTDEDLRALRFTTGFADLLRFEVERARRWLRDGWPLVERMPGQACGGRGPVHARRAGDPGPHRGAGVRRALGPPRGRQAGQARIAGSRRAGVALPAEAARVVRGGLNGRHAG